MIETVNGYVCHNCSDVALAKRNIDPARPEDGPNGVDAKPENDPLRGNNAVTFGGALAAIEALRETDRGSFDASQSSHATQNTAPQAGSRVDLRV